jgi:hypothetical protein
MGSLFHFFICIDSNKLLININPLLLQHKLLQINLNAIAFGIDASNDDKSSLVFKKIVPCIKIYLSEHK